VNDFDHLTAEEVIYMYKEVYRISQSGTTVVLQYGVHESGMAYFAMWCELTENNMRQWKPYEIISAHPGRGYSAPQFKSSDYFRLREYLVAYGADQLPPPATKTFHIETMRHIKY